MKNAALQTQELMRRLDGAGIKAGFSHAETLRRAQMTLHRWSEMECGDGNDFASWAIERDEQSGLPYLCTYPHEGKARRVRIPDREAGALRRIKAVCDELGAHYFHQTDPRGCALYVSAEPLSDSDYSRGIACCI